MITETLHYIYSLNPEWCCAHFGYLFHRIHRRQHASTDDAGMSRVSTGFRRITRITTDSFKLYSFLFKFRREVFVESVNSATVDTTGRQQIPIIDNSICKYVFPNI